MLATIRQFGVGRGLAAAILLASIAILILQQINLTGYMSSDFRIFHDAAIRFAADPYRLYQDETPEVVVANMATLQGYLYPPPSIAAFMPMALVSREAAFVIFTILVLITTFASVRLWLRLLAADGYPLPDHWMQIALVAAVIAIGPVYACRGGQIDTIILWLCVMGLWLGGTRHAWWAGVFYAVGGWIKIYPGLLIAHAVQTAQRRAFIAGFVVAALVIPLLSLAFVPMAVMQQYFDTFLPMMSSRAIINIDNQSLAAVWLRATVIDIDPRTSFAALLIPTGIRVAIALSALASIVAFSLRCRAVSAPPLFVAAWMMALIGPMAPLGWGHSYAYVIPALLSVFLLGVAQKAVWPLILAGFIWLTFVMPSHSQIALDPQSVLSQIFYARYAFATIGLLILLWIAVGFNRVCR
jgi:alpha-1,2-mannosyltransferase